MSRSTLPKSRTDKAKATSATPAVSHEIIPGKYNDQDWNFMVDHDEGDEFIIDIVEEVCSSAMDIIYQGYIQKQLVPFTVSQAKDAILQIIEWQFLAQDPGESNTDSDEGWVQDEEPEPAVTDCWAQGSVPKQRLTPRAPTIMEEDEEPAPLEEETAQETETQTSEEQEAQSENKYPDPEETEEEGGSEPVEEESDIEEVPQSPPPQPQVKVKEKSRPKFKPYTGRVRSAGVGKMVETLDDTENKLFQQEYSVAVQPRTPDPDKMALPASCHSIVKLQAGRPPGNRDVLFDDSGFVLSVTKLDPEKLPSHKVKTNFRVIDPSVEAAQARLEAMRTGKYMVEKVPKPPAVSKPSVMRHTDRSIRTHTTASSSNKQITAKESRPYDVIPLAPPLIDIIAVAPGVLVKEGDQIRKGPKQHKKLDGVFAAIQKTLEPVRMKSTGPTITVAELLQHQTPVVKPLAENMPIPPISQQQTVE